MVKLFPKNTTNFTGNGIAILDDELISVTVTEEINTEYFIELEFPIESEKAKLIEKDMYIECDIPNNQTDIFKVCDDIKKDLDTMYVKCIQIFFTMEDNFIEDTYIDTKSGYAALDQMQSHTQYPHNFSFYSDIDVVSSSRFVRKNFITALLSDEDNSFLSRWGGELEVNKFNVYMRTRRGADRGVTIQYKKNLTGLNAIIKYGEYYTRVIPEGYNGLLLDEKYVDSPLIDPSHPIIRLVKFDDIKVKENVNDEEGYATQAEAKAALKTAAQKLFSEQHADIPQATYEVDFIELTDAEEYKDYSCLERIWLGDTVTVKHPEIGINIKARCVRYTYDALAKRYLTITLGDAIGTFTNNVKDISSKIDKEIDKTKTGFQEYMQQQSDYLQDMINSGDYGYVKITGSEIYIMDTKDVNTAAKVFRLNLGGLGFSGTGVNGPFTGLTQDGKLVINEGTAYKFTAALMQAGILKSIDGRTCFDLDTGKITLYDLINDSYSIEMYDSSIDLFDRFGTSGSKKNMTVRLTSRLLKGEDFGYNLGNTANQRTAAGLYSGYGQALEIGYIDENGKYFPCIIIEGAQAANINQGKRIGVHQDVAILNGKNINWYGTLHDFIGSLYFDANSRMVHWGTGGHSFLVGQQERFKITDTGAEVIGTFTDSSDLARKKNVRPLGKDTLQIIKNVDIYEYEENGTAEIGLLAQEAVKVIPDIIKGEVTDTTIEEANTMTEEERSEKLKGGKGASVDVYSMLSLLWDANKKMLDKIETLENKINELKKCMQS